MSFIEWIPLFIFFLLLLFFKNCDSLWLVYVSRLLLPEMVWCGVAWRGVAWRGVAWRGVAWRGV